MQMVINNEAEFTLGMYSITHRRSQFMTSSEQYFTVPFVLIIPPGRPFTAFEKLFKPFQLGVWLLMLLAFVTASLVMTVIKFQSATIRDFVFGAGNNSPYLNMVNAFLGGSMHLLPGRNFARSLLMMFVLFSLVKRTLYQGALFKFIQADDRNKEVQSVVELVERNFKVFLMPSSLEHTEKMKFRSKRVVVNSTTLEQRKLDSVDSSSNLAVTSSLEQVLFFNKLNYKNMTLTVCREFLFTFQYGIYFRKNSYFEDVFNEKISFLKSNGLIEFWASKFISSQYLHVSLRDGSPRQLNVGQLMGGFEVLFIGLSIGFVVFLLESLTRLWHIRTLQTLIDFFT